METKKTKNFEEEVNFFEILTEKALALPHPELKRDLNFAEQQNLNQYHGVMSGLLDDLKNNAKRNPALSRFLKIIPEATSPLEKRSLGFFKYSLWKWGVVLEANPNNSFLRKELKKSRVIFNNSASLRDQKRFIDICQKVGL